MSNYSVPSNLRFSETHEWVEDLGNNKYRIGISDFAAQHVGDITYVELPEINEDVDNESVVCNIETVKSSEDINNQISGTVSAINEMLSENPEIIVADCYGDGWLYEVQSDSDEDFKALMSADEYDKFLDEQDDE
ncbi:glycine cleavage system protein GcvH [bacterium]|nr:glycine cleavage system protein GcvH [bacterium]MBR6244090.1 glycine cleavage system protein GcvH [bacterium]